MGGWGETNEKLPGTAIVVIHGVADQRPGETVLAVANLHSSSTGWVQRTTWLSNATAQGTDAFPVSQLDGELDGRPVHLSEVYWADLSRPGRGLFEMLGSLFGVLAVLPRIAIAQMEPGLQRRLLILARFLLFGVVVPLIYAGAGAALALVPAVRASGPSLEFWRDPWLAAGVALVATGACAAAYRVGLAKESTRDKGTVAVTALLVLVFAAIFALAVFSPALVLVAGFMATWIQLGVMVFRRVRSSREEHRHWRVAAPLLVTTLLFLAAAFVLGEWWIVAAFVIAFLLTYRGVRTSQDSITVSWIAVAASLVALWLVGSFMFYAGGEAAPWVHTNLVLTQLAFMTACTAFAACCVTILLTAVGLPWANDARVSTAHLSLLVPTVLILLLAIPVLSAVASILHTSHLLQTPEAVTYDATSWDLLTNLEPYRETAEEHRHHLISAEETQVVGNPQDLSLVLMAMARASGTSLLLWVVLALAIVLVGANLLLLPPAFAAGLPKETRNERTRVWIDGATRNLVTLSIAVGVIVLLVLTAGYGFELAANQGWGEPGWRAEHGALSGHIVAALGVAVAGGAALLAFPDRLRALLAPIWPALDILADVVSYLDDEDGTKPKILGRARRVLELAERHERLVVVAHSQGTVIAFDALSAKASAGAEPRVAVLVTCGSPLRHLYQRFFPAAWGSLDAALRDPRSIGVRSWINVAATSDYVGMRLSRTPLKTTAREESLSSVGHTSYFRSDNDEMKAILRAGLKSAET